MLSRCAPNRAPNGPRVGPQEPATPTGLRLSPTREVMPRATAAETSNRIDALQGMILAGTPNTECLAFARKEWGISRARGYELMKRAWSQIKDDVDQTGIDRLELLAWSIQTLMSAAGQAKQQKNPGAVVACIKQLDWMTGLGINSTSGQRGHRSHR